MITLNSKVEELNRVGKTLSSRLKRIGIETVNDLIFYYPFRYEDYSRIYDIDKLKSGQMATVRGVVESFQTRRTRYRKKTITEGLIGDKTGSVKVVWFNQPWISNNIKIGDEVNISGKVKGDLFDLQFNSPNYEKTSSSGLNTARLIPVYSSTSGVTQKQWRFLIKSIIDLVDQVDDYAPEQIIRQEKYLALPKALKEIHFPANKNTLELARKRLAFDELFLLQLWSQMVKKDLQEKMAPKIIFRKNKTRFLVKSFDFILTNDQKKSAWEIIRDLAENKPMNRLLEGDVGSGKTVVVAMAIYNVALNKCQSVFMAPTEILVRQHFKTLIKLFKDSDISVGLLTRTQRLIFSSSLLPKGEGERSEERVSKKDFIDYCRQRKIDVIVGTHSLIQKEVVFKKLGLIIIDEQHRFGVEQRQAIKHKNKKTQKQKNTTPHFLSLTATPIPRSLALTLYGDLDLSVIREMPKNRKEIITRVASPDKRQLAYEFINKQIKKGRQIFVVCPLIDPSDKLGAKSVSEEFKKLDEQVFPDLSIGLLHGRLKPKEKEKAINDFANNKTKILVSTSVIEVGVDIPNASVMMIEGAERFGLAQLHQFRGRVGRSSYQSYCFLFTDSNNEKVITRLKALINCADGFALAQRDLKFRGAGQIFGEEQSGFYGLKIAKLDDLEQIKKIRDLARNFVENEKLESYPLLEEKLKGMGFGRHME